MITVLWQVGLLWVKLLPVQRPDWGLCHKNSSKIVSRQQLCCYFTQDWISVCVHIRWARFGSMKESEGKFFFKLCDVQKHSTHQEERHEKNNRYQKHKEGIKTSFGMRQWNTCGWKSTQEKYRKYSKRNYCIPNGYACHWAINTSGLETRVKFIQARGKKSSDVR